MSSPQEKGLELRSDGAYYEEVESLKEQFEYDDTQENGSDILLDGSNSEKHFPLHSPANASTFRPKPQQRPIVVGYVFGPKKMSTMGVVMAEASRTQLSSSHHLHEGLLFDEEEEEDDDNEDDEDDDYRSTGLTQARLSTHDEQEEGYREDYQHQAHSQQHASPATTMLFTVEGPHAAGGTGSLQNIVRYFRSSCSSSLEDSLSTGTCTASTTSQRTSNSASLPTATSTTRSTSSSSHPPPQSNSIRARQHRQTVRVSFVPLDPDTPLEEQHGGQMDVILHKLTEDILCLSQLSKQQQQQQQEASNDTSQQPDMNTLVDYPDCTETEKAAVLRVHRLLEFQKSAGCSLVDDPLKVQVLMSRQDISQRLVTCLKGVVTASGIPVGSPASVALSTPPSDVTDVAAWMAQQTEHLAFPRIVKPLIAAGTKASHKMAVVTNVTACHDLLDFLPCLCQEYANHHAVLYKVYVLGSYVSVHKRRSLPNLELYDDETEMIPLYEFDSQRPYPRLQDFYAKPTTTTTQQPRASKYSTSSYKEPVVTTEELEPVVQALKSAFGLELFGFDLIYASDDSNPDMEGRWLVVDVNYFPSYKEVPQFPALLARYLLGRALERRKKTVTETTTTA